MAFPNIGDIIRNLFGKNTIKLAVIGATSSGKTYLLTDLITALNKMGYFPDDSDNDNSCHAPISMFIPNVNDPSGILATPIYTCRPENCYSGKLSNEALGRSFNLTFVDIPGEVITRDSIMEFQAIMTAMKHCKSKIFKVTTWRQKGGKGIKRTVSYINAHKIVDATDYQQENGISLKGEKTTLNTIFGAGGIPTNVRTQEYVSTELYIDRLSHSYDKKKEENITGNYLFHHFSEFATDTAIQCIVDAWEAMEVDNYMFGNSTAASSDFGLSATDSNKDRFEKVYKNHFYFHYFTCKATDVVICDKMTVPTGVELIGTHDYFNYMIEALKTLVWMKSSVKKNWYMAFRGVDSIMEQEYFKSLFQSTDHNTTYSFFNLMLSLKLAKQSQADSVFAAGSSDTTSDITESTTLWNLITGLEDEHGIMDTCLDHYQHFDSVDTKYFRPTSEYQIVSESDPSSDSHGRLDFHIKGRVKAFMALVKILKLDTTDPCAQALKMPPHTYYTASPIDYDFNIHSNSPSDVTKFGGIVANPDNRICFGTYQLVSDLLLSHNKSLPDEATEYGTILDYMYQN